MASSIRVLDYISSPENFIRNFYDCINSIDSNLLSTVEFKSQVQKNNLMSLVKEANNKINKYESIYPYIKEMCMDQTINPEWYGSIEKVLNWALKKGRGKSRILSKDIKNAWITYIIVLSCSMIDNDQPNRKVRKNIFLKSENGKLIGLKGNNR